MSPPARGAWIEIARSFTKNGWRKSPPARGAWIEIVVNAIARNGKFVAPRTGGVD